MKLKCIPVIAAFSLPLGMIAAETHDQKVKSEENTSKTTTLAITGMK